MELPQLLADAEREGWRQFVRTPSDEAAMLAGYSYNARRAARVEEFSTQYVRHSTGRWAGKPFALLEWQREQIVRPLFGWVHRATGLRRFRYASIWIPKKNGKSALCSLLTLYLLIADREARAEVYAAAVDRSQAGLVFDESARMVRGSPALKKATRIVDSTKSIVFRDSVYRALSGEHATSEGKNIHGLVMDELHAWNTPSLRRLFGSLYYGGAAREQPLSIVISTAGEEDPEALWGEEWERAREILKGTTVDIRRLAFVAAADPRDDLTSPEVQARANPSLGEIIRPDDLAAEVRDAAGSPRKLAMLKRYRFNIPTSASVEWIAPEIWAACDDPPQFPEGCEVCLGLDLSSTNDLTAVVECRREFEADDTAEDRYHFRFHFFCPEDRIADLEREQVYTYRAWADQGILTVIPGPAISNAFIRQHIRGISQRVQIAEIGYDEWSARETAETLTMQDGLTCVKMRQGMATLSEPTKKLEKLVRLKKINHGKNPIMDWMMGHCRVKHDENENIRPVKPTGESKKKIDGVVAAVMALARAMLRQPNQWCQLIAG